MKRKPSLCDVTDGTEALLPDRRHRPSSPLGVPCSLFCPFPNAWKVQQSIGCSKKLQRLSSMCKGHRQQASLNSSQLGKRCTSRRHFAHAASCRAPRLLESAVPLLLPAEAQSNASKSVKSSRCSSSGCSLSRSRGRTSARLPKNISTF